MRVFFVFAGASLFVLITSIYKEIKEAVTSLNFHNLQFSGAERNCRKLVTGDVEKLLIHYFFHVLTCLFLLIF